MELPRNIVVRRIVAHGAEAARMLYSAVSFEERDRSLPTWEELQAGVPAVFNYATVTNGRLSDRQFTLTKEGGLLDLGPIGSEILAHEILDRYQGPQEAITVEVMKERAGPVLGEFPLTPGLVERVGRM